MDTGARLQPGEVLIVGDYTLTLLDIADSSVLLKPSWGNGEPFTLRSTLRLSIPNGVIWIFRLFEDAVTLNVNDNGDNHIEVRRNSGEVELRIYIRDAEPDFEFQQIERIQYAVGAFLEEFGFEAVPEHDPMTVYGSWDWRAWFRRNSPEIQQELSDTYAEMKESLRLQHVDVHAANVFSTRATAARDLIDSLEPYDEAVIRFGDVLLAKATINGKSRILVENVTPSLGRQLAANPVLTRDPHALFHFFSHQAVEHQPNEAIESHSAPPKLEHTPPDNPIA